MPVNWFRSLGYSTLYEIIPADSDESVDSIDPWISAHAPSPKSCSPDELLTIKLGISEEEEPTDCASAVDTHTAFGKDLCEFSLVGCSGRFLECCCVVQNDVRAIVTMIFAMLAQGPRGTDSSDIKPRFISWWNPCPPSSIRDYHVFSGGAVHGASRLRFPPITEKINLYLYFCPMVKISVVIITGKEKTYPL